MRKKKSNQPSDFELDKYGVWVKTKLGSSFDTTQNIEKEVERTEPPHSFTPQKNDSFTFDSIHTQIENIKKDLSDLKNEIKDSKIENFSLFSNKPVDFFADHPSLKSESNSSDFGIGSLSKTDDLLSDFDTSEQNNNPTEKDKQDAELSSSIDSLFTDDLELTEEDIRSFDEETQPTCVNDKFDFFDEKNIEETLPEEATSDLILDPLEDFDLPEEKEIEFPKAKESDEDNDFFDIFNFNFKEPEESDKQKEEQPLEEVTSPDGEAIFDNEHFSFFDDNKIAPTEEPIVEEPIVEEPIVEEPIVEEPIVEEPIVEDSAVEDSAVEDSTVEDSIVEDSTVEDSTVEDSTVEDSIVEDSIVEDSIVEDSIVEDSIVEDSIVEEPIVEDSEPAFFLSEDNTDLDDIGFTDTEGMNTIQPGINDGLRETAEEPVVENDELGTVNGVIHLHEDEPTEEQSLQPDKEETEEETLTLSDNELLSLLNTNEEITDEKTESVTPRETAADEFSAVEPETEEERAFFDSLNWTSEEPIVEEPIVEEPTVEEPTVEEPTVEEPTVEEPTVEEPTVEEPTVEEPTVEEPTVEEPIVEDSTVEEPTVEEPIVEDSAVEDSTVEEPIVEEPIVEEPIVEEPIVEEPIVEEPIVEEPTVEEPTVEEPIVEEPIVEEPIVEEPKEDFSFAAFDISDEDFDLTLGDENSDTANNEKEVKTVSEDTDINDLSFFDDLDFGFENEESAKKKVNFDHDSENDSDEDLKKEVKELIQHIEKVLGEIPQEKIEEFTHSPEYTAYRKLFTDLGLE